ncbi:hypothetical protein ZWY2020_036438 [Hordeum vulgare]|nr:hypothetical protein ZWY2020_036438 [Hordeum vulgare]
MFDFEFDMSGELDLGSWATSAPSCEAAEGVCEVPAAALRGDMLLLDLELDMSGDMDLGSYHADFAEGLLLEPLPPPPADAAAVCWGDGGGDAACALCRPPLKENCPVWTRRPGTNRTCYQPA